MGENTLVKVFRKQIDIQYIGSFEVVVAIRNAKKVGLQRRTQPTSEFSS